MRSSSPESTSLGRRPVPIVFARQLGDLDLKTAIGVRRG
jgi:hypothetical protein